MLTILDPALLMGARCNPWRCNKNATVTFKRVLSEAIDPCTNNFVPDDCEVLTVPVHFKKASLVNEDGKGVPVGSYKAVGYTVGILPDWAKLPTAERLECVIDFLGSGYFHFQGKIHTSYPRVESAVGGTKIQGYFTLQGSGVNAGYI